LNNLKYIKKENNTKKLIRTEIVFAPILIILPFIVGVMLIRDYYIRGFLFENNEYLSQLFLGLIIIIGNIIFDIPFIKSLIKLSKNNK